MVRFSFLLMLSILTLVGCKDDDDGDPFMDDSLVGTWNVTTYDVDLTAEVVGFGSETITSTIVSSDATVTFVDDGTWSTAGQTEFSVTEGDSTYIETGTSSETGTWSVTGTQVKLLNDDPEDATFTVEDFVVTSFAKDSRVALHADVDETEVDPFFGFTITSMGTVDIVLEQ